MPTKLIAIYRKPDDEAAFNKHYDEVHTPIVMSIPGLQDLTVNRIKQQFMGEDNPYMIAEMSFADGAAFKQAMKSEENQAAGRDIANFADGIVSLVVAES